MELRHCLEGGVMWLHGPGLGWDSTCMEVRLKSLNPDPDEIGPEWRWDTYLESLMGLWGCLYGAEMQLWCPGWGWDVTWMEMRYKHKDLDWGEKPHGWKRGVNQSTWGWWDVNLETWMRMRWELDWVETHILRPGWDKISRNWDLFIVALMIRYNLNGDEMRIKRIEWIWARRASRYLGVHDKWPRQRLEAILST